MKRLLAFAFLAGCAAHEELLTPDEFRLDTWRAELDHDNNVFDGEQNGVGLGLTWYISGPSWHDRELAGKLDELIELGEVQPTEPQTSPAHSEDSDLTKLILIASGASALTGAGGWAAGRKLKG